MSNIPRYLYFALSSVVIFFLHPNKPEKMNIVIIPKSTIVLYSYILHFNFHIAVIRVLPSFRFFFTDLLDLVSRSMYFSDLVVTRFDIVNILSISRYYEIHISKHEVQSRSCEIQSRNYEMFFFRIS